MKTTSVLLSQLILFMSLMIKQLVFLKNYALIAFQQYQHHGTIKSDLKAISKKKNGYVMYRSDGKGLITTPSGDIIYARGTDNQPREIKWSDTPLKP